MVVRHAEQAGAGLHQSLHRESPVTLPLSGTYEGRPVPQTAEALPRITSTQRVVFHATVSHIVHRSHNQTEGPIVASASWRTITLIQGDPA